MTRLLSILISARTLAELSGKGLDACLNTILEYMPDETLLDLFRTVDSLAMTIGRLLDKRRVIK